MNLLKTIIERLNQRVEVANIFDQIYPLCEINANGNEKAWVHYIGNGQAEVVTNFDAKQGTLFWAKRGKVSVTKTESLKVSGCKTLYLTTFPLTAYAVVRKSHLPCDSEDSQDWIASRIYRLISGTDPDFKVSIGVIQYEVIPNGYVNEIKSLTSNYEWACVAVDVDVNVVSSSEDGCYDVCATGDIPLPDFQPCTPCLTEVAVDGVTITGNGTTADPLVAVGGGGGSILLKTDGVNNGSQTILNLKEGTNITLTDDGIGGVTIDASGGGLPQSLQEVTDVGNTTTNDILFGSGVGAIFNNGAKVKEGTTDAGLGGAKGVAMICSNAYELKWEAGRLYYMEQNGFTIREVTHNFTITPLVTDDSTKGFVVGSRWTLDNGDLYICSDDTIGAAVWNLQSVGGVTDVTATGPLSSSGGTTPDISITQASTSVDGYLSQTDWNTFNGKFDVPTGTTSDYLDGTGTPTIFPTIPTVTPSALTKTDDTNVTLTLGGSPTTSLLAATSLTLGWSGTLADARIASAATWNAKQNAITTGTTLQYFRGDLSLATFPTALPPSGAASGDLIGTYPSPNVSKIHGIDMQSGTPTADDLWIYGGAPAKWQHGKIKTINSTSLIGTGNITTGTVTSVASLTLGTSGTDLSSSVATGTTTPVITLNVPTASAANRGALSAADWTTFNSKQAAITPAALTKVDDTNVTLTLGGSPTTALLQGTSITAGWSGTLADARITSAATWNAKQSALVSGTNIKTINSTSLLGSGNYATPFELVIAASDESTSLTTGTAKITFRMPRAVTLTAVRASLTTAQTSGSLLTINIKESGTTILSTKITINNTQKTSTTATTLPVISDTALADDAEMTIDIDQIGDGTAKGLKVYLIGNYA